MTICLRHFFAASLVVALDWLKTPHLPCFFVGKIDQASRSSAFCTRLYQKQFLQEAMIRREGPRSHTISRNRYRESHSEATILDFADRAQAGLTGTYILAVRFDVGVTSWNIPLSECPWLVTSRWRYYTLTSFPSLKALIENLGVFHGF
jgi:hypothetical protein